MPVPKVIYLSDCPEQDGGVKKMFKRLNNWKHMLSATQLVTKDDAASAITTESKKRRKLKDQLKHSEVDSLVNLFESHRDAKHHNHFHHPRTPQRERNVTTAFAA